MKIIYDFTIPREEEVEETVTSKNDKGEEVKTTKKTKKSVDKTFVLKKPGRKLYDEAELFYGVKLSEGIKAGLLTRALLAKRFNNDGGVLSENEKDKFAELYIGLYEKQGKLQELELKKNNLTEDEKNLRQALIDELNNSRQELQEFEMSQASLFDQTAENRARNKTILWWVTQIAYEKIGENEYKPVFGEGEYEQRIAVYDELEEDEDTFVEDMLTKLSYYVSFWYITKPGTREELEALLNTADENELPDLEDAADDEAPKEEASVKETRRQKKQRLKREAQESKQKESTAEEDVGVENPQPENA